MNWTYIMNCLLINCEIGPVVDNIVECHWIQVQGAFNQRKDSEFQDSVDFEEAQEEKSLKNSFKVNKLSVYRNCST